MLPALECSELKGGLVRKKELFIGVVVFLIGMIPLYNSINDPRMAAARVPEFLRLIGSGMLFGVGLALFLGAGIFRSK
jgi:hypothetical protein